MDDLFHETMTRFFKKNFFDIQLQKQLQWYLAMHIYYFTCECLCVCVCYVIQRKVSVIHKAGLWLFTDSLAWPELGHSLLFKGVCYTHSLPVVSLSLDFLLFTFTRNPLPCTHAVMQSYSQSNVFKNKTPFLTYTAHKFHPVTSVPLLTRRVCASKSCDGEEEADCQGRKRLALWDPLLYSLQSGLRSSGQS